MPRISESTIREVNERMDALAIVGDYVRLENRGGRFWGLCPFHHEKTASFTVDPDKKFYHCFGCGEGGGIVNFVMNIDKLSYPEAIELIARKSGVEIVYDAVDGEAVAEERKQGDALKDLYERVAKSYHYILTEKPLGETARAYLAGREVSEAMIKRFNLGYAPPDRRWLFDFLTHKGYSENFLAESGLFGKKYTSLSFFSGRLMFPIHNREGKTVAFGGRLLAGEEGPKYLNSSESVIFRKRDNLFALDFALPEIRRTKEVFLVEGYMDVIAMHEAGITNTVAPLGTAFTEDQAKLLRRYADRALLFFDTDEAGQKAIEKGIMTCTGAGLECRVIIAEGTDAEPDAKLDEKKKDPAEILQKNGAEYLKKIIRCGILPLPFLIARSRTLYDISDPGGKQKAIESLFPYIKIIESELARSDALLAVADAFLCDSAALSRDYRVWLSGAPGVFLPKGKNGVVAPVRLTEELFLLMTVVANRESHPEFLAKLRGALSIEEINDANAKELYIAVEEWLRSGEESAGIGGIFPYIRPQPLRAFAMQKCGGEEFAFDAERLFAESLHNVRKQRLEARRKHIVQKLRLLGNKAGRETEELLEDKMYIDRELQRELEVKK
ncbi:MAG: DNA primase [Spirochaetaceae bacterium]|jgi:DNA primase|nr:DNA primase [Spirochaetaceae bacterium]